MWKWAAYLFAASAAIPMAAAQPAGEVYPSRPVRFVVPFTAGGSADKYARILAQKMSEAWNVQVVVDNRAGGNGIIGTDIVAKSSADAYTLLLGTGGNIATNPALYKRLPYRASDFSAVSLITTSPFVLLTPLSLPVNSVQELLTLARAKPGQLNYVSTGVGSPGHLAAELLAVMTRIKIVHVPYKAHGTMMADIAAGSVHLWFNGVAPAQAQMRAGKVRALAVTSAARARALPHVPTVAESGVPGYEVVGWYGVFVPSGTPRARIRRLNGEVTAILREPDVRERFFVDGAEPVGNDSSQFSAFVVQEMKKWANLVKLTGITAD